MLRFDGCSVWFGIVNWHYVLGTAHFDVLLDAQELAVLLFYDAYLIGEQSLLLSLLSFKHLLCGQQGAAVS